MPNWYIYYRLLLALRYGRPEANATPRIELQDVLGDLRTKAKNELHWTDQNTQDFFESLVLDFKSANISAQYTVDEAMRRVRAETRRQKEYGL